MLRAHPRSRGENGDASSHKYGPVGSSPLTRGKPSLPSYPQSEGGLIPAHAGKTIFGLPRSSSPRAHPRSRGENATPACWSTRGGGSSPLTRGKLRHDHPTTDRTRLIPAHAGKTATLARALSCFWAHPRSRGENQRGGAQCGSWEGSSPLTRGKPTVSRSAVGSAGLIPAHAGKTPTWSASSTWTRAHPRSRGENDARYIPLIHERGSSPLTRGKPSRSRSSVFSVRLIPAHAGKTGEGVEAGGGVGAHPRSRGENSGGCDPPQLPRGSSPLTRGKRRSDDHRLPERRLIPAHAGKTAPGGRTESLPRAHPRSRGENVYQAVKSSGMRGSSPLTRGKPRPCRPP